MCLISLFFKDFKGLKSKFWQILEINRLRSSCIWYQFSYFPSLIVEFCLQKINENCLKTLFRRLTWNCYLTADKRDLNIILSVVDTIFFHLYTYNAVNLSWILAYRTYSNDSKITWNILSYFLFVSYRYFNKI